MENFEKEELKIFVEDQDSLLCVRWAGKSASRQPGTFLNPYMDRIIARATTTVEIDFIGLRFMNSPTVLPILVLLNGLAEKKLPVQVVYDNGSPWQRTVFGGLKGFSFKGEVSFHAR